MCLAGSTTGTSNGIHGTRYSVLPSGVLMLVQLLYVGNLFRVHWYESHHPADAQTTRRRRNSARPWLMRCLSASPSSAWHASGIRQPAHHNAHHLRSKNIGRGHFYIRME